MKKSNSYLLIITMVSALGGFLFGYDWVVIGGAKPFYEQYFGISNLSYIQGWVMASAIIGCLIGVIFSGFLSDKFGRKPLLIIAAAIFTMAAVGTGAVSSIFLFVIFRIFGGIGIGIASNLSPIYIAEIAPEKIRGKMVSINQLTIVLGILSAQVVNWLIADKSANIEMLNNQSWNVQMGWRWMFWSGAVPSVIFFVLVYFIPESPRWLAGKLKYNSALSVLHKVLGKDRAQQQLLEIKENQKTIEKINYKNLLQKNTRAVIFLGIFIAVFQQWSGINIVFNYAEEIFTAAGYGISDLLFNVVITGITNVVFTLFGMYLVDIWGRRYLMLLGAISLGIIYGILSLCYYYQVTGTPVLILVILAIGTYAMTLAPVTWVLLSEIFPTKIRGGAMAIATFFLWTACFILTFTFPVMNSAIGTHGAFLVYGVICLLSFVLLYIKLPETKGKTLEEIEKVLKTN